MESKVTKQCKFKFAIDANFIDELEADVTPLDVCKVTWGSPYMYVKDVVFN